MVNEFVLIGFYIVTLIYSVIIHEVSHGVVALWLGDVTAKYADRLNLNLMKHIDPFGSIVLPLLLVISHAGFVFGWAKPVPYNPYNLKNQKWGQMLVGIAGPISNFLLAFLAALIARSLPLTLAVKTDVARRFIDFVFGRGEFMDTLGLLAAAISGSLASILFVLCLFIVYWNVILGCFNLLPIPPLDGSKIIYSLFSVSERTQMLLEQYGLFLLILVILFLSLPIGIFINFVLGHFLAFAL